VILKQASLPQKKWVIWTGLTCQFEVRSSAAGTDTQFRRTGREIDLAREQDLGLILGRQGPHSPTMPPSKTKKSHSRPVKLMLDIGSKVIDAFKIRKSEQAKEPKAEFKAPIKPYRVVELFAGVGGFRIGLESVLKGKAFQVVWSNQYEPGSSKQWASRVYEHEFPDSKTSKHSNKLIEEAIASGEVPAHDVLVGGFPCQDYSVAKPNNQSRGIEGKKGVLWWSIYEIAKLHAPKFLILENVDRLVKSPAKQRGRDFAIMLKCLADLGYVVEWRVINAAEYGMPQRRRRVFIVAYKAKEIIGKLRALQSPENILLNDGILARAFPVQTIKPTVALDDDEDAETDKETKIQEQLELFMQATWSTTRTIIEGDPHEITETFNKGNAKHDPFMNAGLMIPGQGTRPSVWTAKVYPKYDGRRINLGDLLTPENKVPEEFNIDSESLKSWVHQKGSKTETRTNYLTTFTHIQALFEEIGIKAKLTNTQKRTWGKELAAYWKDNPTVGKSLKLKDEETGQEVSVSWKLISDTRFHYEFKEGPLPMPDPLDRPFRTIITSEGGSSPSRFKHVICRECAKNWAKKGEVLDHNCVKAGKFRRLTPEELEKGNMFPAGHTQFCMLEGEKVEVDPKHRAFFMGNALVVGIVARIGKTLVKC
jgi:DNA (cytosine-5)-methyltransferase 1